MALILPGDLAAHQERVLAQLRDRDDTAAGRLASLLQSQGVTALDGLVALPPPWTEGAPPQLWAAVNRLANTAGRFSTARAAALREAEDPAADRGAALVARGSLRVLRERPSGGQESRRGRRGAR